MSLSGGNMGGGGGGGGGGGRSGPPPPGGPLDNKPPPTQFTEQELAVMEGIKGSVAFARRIGIIVGLGVGYALAARRKPPVSLGTRIVFPLMGSFGGGALAMPLGVMYGQKYMGQVEDEEHFKRAVITAVEAKRAGQPSPLSAPPKRQPQQQGEGGYPSLSNRDTMSSQSPSQQQKEVAWADDGFDPSALYQNNEPRDPMQQQGYSSPYASTSAMSGPSIEQQPQQDQQPSSRWAQVRGERGPNASTWDRIRQQNAQQGYQQRSAPASSVDGYGGGAGSGGPPMADPTFGKGVSSSRAQSQREYEASFQRERRGVDG